MSRIKLDELLENTSASFRKLNAGILHDRGETPGPVVERDPRHGALAAPKAQASSAGKFFIRVVSYRRRLLDEDNLAEKYFVDCLRYSGLIPGDSPDRCRIVTTQEKVGSKEEERTEITVDLMLDK